MSNWIEENGKEYYTKYRAENREKISKYNRQYRRKNAEKIAKWNSEWRKKNRDTILANQEKYRKSDDGKEYHDRYIKKYLSNPVNRMRYLYNAVARRARNKGIKIDANLREVLMDNPPTNCLCCGKTFDLKSIGKGQENKWDSPSVDRFDNNKGYTVKNIRIICVRCNSLKADAAIEELERIIAYMKNA